MLDIQTPRSVDEPARFTGLGIRNVFLVNGFAKTKKGVMVNDLDSLNQVVVKELCNLRRPLAGNEFRVLRRYIRLTLPSTFALIGETKIYDAFLELKNVVPEKIDVLVRFIALTKLGERNLPSPEALIDMRRCNCWSYSEKFTFQWNETGWYRVHTPGS